MKCIYLWLARVTLLVVFGLCPNFLGGGRGPMNAGLVVAMTIYTVPR